MTQTSRRIDASPVRQRKTLGAFLLALLLAGGAHSQDTEQHSWIPEIGAEATAAEQLTAAEIVEAMYGKAQWLLRGSGHDVVIEVDAFESMTHEAFATARWTDLVTLGGPSIRLVPIFMDSNVVKPTVHVSAEWAPAEDVSTERTELPDISVQEAAAILDRPGFHKEIWPAIDGISLAVTSYAVSLEAFGERLTYRAATFWRQLEDGTYSASIQDPVLPIDLIVWIDEPPTPHQNLTSLTADQGERIPFARPAAKMQLCEIDMVDTFGTSLSLSGASGHQTGSHSATIQLGAVWTCAAQCTASCAPEAITATCKEDPSSTYTNGGVTSHKLFRAIRLKGQSQNPGQATCAIGQQCAFAECLAGVCPGVMVGVGITIVGSGANVTFRNTSNAIDTFDLEDSITLPCKPLPFCSTSQTVVHALSIDGVIALPPGKSGYTLGRVETSNVVHHGKHVRYLMEEWALVGHGAAIGGSRSVLDASSTAYAQAQADRIATTGPIGAGKQLGASRTMLVIEAPAHEDNDRRIPLPTLRFADDPLPTEMPTGRAIVRIDVADDRSIRDLTVIQDTVGGVSPALLEAIRDRLILDFASAQQHRVITFAVLEIGDTVKTLDSVVLLPKCCGCVPVPGHSCE